MPQVAEISVQPTSDPNMKAYHTRFEMSSGPEQGSRGNFDELGEFGRLFLKIKGIVQVHVCPYTLLVTKASLYEWPEIDPDVIKILRHFAISERQLAESASLTIAELDIDQKVAKSLEDMRGVLDGPEDRIKQLEGPRSTVRRKAPQAARPLQN